MSEIHLGTEKQPGATLALEIAHILSTAIPGSSATVVFCRESGTDVWELAVALPDASQATFILPDGTSLESGDVVRVLTNQTLETRRDNTSVWHARHLLYAACLQVAQLFFVQTGVMPSVSQPSAKRDGNDGPIGAFTVAIGAVPE